MIFFTADLHLGHNNIIRYSGRPFRDVEEMDAALIRAWNDVVGHGDHVFVLGDFALGRRKETVPLVRQLAGTKHLIAGNHDGCWAGHSSHRRQRQFYLDAGFESVTSTLYAVIADRDVRMCHFPYTAHDDRFAEWLPQDTGEWLLHGHVHEKWRVRGRQINVGVDAWGGHPVPEAVIEAYVQADLPVHQDPLPW